jgi:hypothetical protein
MHCLRHLSRCICVSQHLENLNLEMTSNSLSQLEEEGQLTPCGGGLEYFYRRSASRKRRQKGNPVIRNETVMCGHEFYRT